MEKQGWEQEEERLDGERRERENIQHLGIFHVAEKFLH